MASFLACGFKTQKSEVMKKLILLLAMSIGLTSFSQVSVSVNIGAPPVWAPAAPVNVGFYYLPDIHSYYDVHTTEFIYLNRGHWVRARHLPAPYRGYNLHRGRTVYLTDYHGHAPYKYYSTHRVKYKKHPVHYKHKGPKHHKKHHRGRHDD